MPPRPQPAPEADAPDRPHRPVPFAVLSVHINPNGTNLAGIDANVALFGAVLLIFGVFNAVFLPAFYKTAVRVGRSFLLAVVPMTVLMVLGSTSQ